MSTQFGIRVTPGGSLVPWVLEMGEKDARDIIDNWQADGKSGRVVLVSREVSDWELAWDKDHAQNAKCADCNHDYIRHWDTYEDPPEPVGCKYCPCGEFVEPTEEKSE